MVPCRIGDGIDGLSARLFAVLVSVRRSFSYLAAPSTACSPERLLARPQSQKRARSPCLYGGDITGTATGEYFRREEGAFLGGHYLAAEVASPTVERCGPRMLRLIGAVRHGFVLANKNNATVSF